LETLFGVGGEVGQDLVVVSLFGEELFVVGVAVELSASHAEGGHAEGGIADAASEGGLVDDFALHFELLHRVDHLRTGLAGVTAPTLERHFYRFLSKYKKF